MKVEVIERDTIKPSSPTPHHLRDLQLSFLDQIAIPVFMPLILFYPRDSNTSNGNRSDRLKKSLSGTLTKFYPLAGRVKDSSKINCNDEGVHYVVAHARCQVSEVIQQPDPAQLNSLLPYELDNVGELVLAIQVNIFDCGGMAIGICISHKVADALSLIMFLNSWAATVRGDHSNTICPNFDLASLFPPRNMSGFMARTGIVKENIVTKRFVFSASMIDALKEKFADNASMEQTRRPTRIEALSAFIWSRFMAVTQENIEKERLYTVLHAVNLRTRMDPPLPEYYFGNISGFAIATPSMDTKEEDQGYGLVKQVRDAIKKVDGDYVRKLQEGKGHLNFMKERAAKLTKGEVVSFRFTSLCRFPLYETDFGWGKPLWVGSASLTFKNLVVFMDTGCGNGIEAWLNLEEMDMAKLQDDKELLAFVSPNHMLQI
ncbi:stemmadenine O-acetyltransferase-like [Juglans microcarpa x Juglans regia]|uniref:stemmadenine O-acetyltransferase-like n=1 Tax=Juglans microcarpa x Juglans regia TaxID=2249226 RepID=UPI001B7E4962|nr:stemmadenine O-acetyltransferase-like [Juglans microcarpa x Juglans regia]